MMGRQPAATKQRAHCWIGACLQCNTRSRAGVSMDASQDVLDWDWEVVMPDHRSFSTSQSHGSKNLDDKETEEHDLLSPSGNFDDVQVECKDIGVVLDETCKSVVPSVVDPIMAPDGGEEEKAIQSPDPIMAPDGKFAQEEEEDEEDIKDGDDKVGALIGALCSFGVAAATACVFLIGGRLHHHHTQHHKFQLQFFGDDKRIQQVVRQTSRLNQKAMSFAMGAGASRHFGRARVKRSKNINY
ncbi:uncharacterized protein [Zea mays]|nr:uncharacterized protein LOC100274720 isoform X1 [Zea mays]|eukprot:XP_008672546.1 uncharacterized protein LOC100274720 isoform X1 [Zea mays]